MPSSPHPGPYRASGDMICGTDSLGLPVYVARVIGPVSIHEEASERSKLATAILLAAAPAMRDALILQEELDETEELAATFQPDQLPAKMLDQLAALKENVKTARQFALAQARGTK